MPIMENSLSTPSPFNSFLEGQLELLEITGAFNISSHRFLIRCQVSKISRRAFSFCSVSFNNLGRTNKLVVELRSMLSMHVYAI